MREILFKAKRLDNGEWVTGSCVKFDEEHVFVLPIHENASTLTYSQIFSLNAVMVDPSTVCEYTGLKDENGNKIFEYDVVSLKENGEPEGIIEYGSWNCGCCYDVYGFYGVSEKGICAKKMTLYHDENKCAGIYVVGNIHDREE